MFLLTTVSLALGLHSFAISANIAMGAQPRQPATVQSIVLRTMPVARRVENGFGRGGFSIIRTRQGGPGGINPRALHLMRGGPQGINP